LKLGIFVTAFLTCDESQRAPFIKQYIYVTRSNGDSFPEFVDDISSDMNYIRDRDQHLSESKLRNDLIEHLKYTNTTMLIDGESIFILYPFPQIHMTMTRKSRRPSIRNLGGGRGKKMRAKGRKTRKFN
jgi:hypothetical protein